MGYCCHIWIGCTQILTLPPRPSYNILHLHKSQVGLEIENCCHIWAGAAQAIFSSLYRVQKYLRIVVGDEQFPTLQPLSSQTKGYFLVVVRVNFIPLFHQSRNSQLGSAMPHRHAHERGIRGNASPFPSYSIWQKEVPLSQYLLRKCGMDAPGY